jgi:hypothetical protein
MDTWRLVDAAIRGSRFEAERAVLPFPPPCDGWTGDPPGDPVPPHAMNSEMMIATPKSAMFRVTVMEASANQVANE